MAHSIRDGLPSWQSSQGSVLQTLTLVAIVYLASLSIYNILLHPLRSFPGPLVAKFTRLRYWVAMFKGEEAKYMQGLHAKYGPVVRYTPTSLSYCDGRAFRDVYTREKGREENIKDTRVDPLKGDNAPPISSAHGEDHARMRRSFAPAFSERALRLQEPLFQQYTEKMVSKLNEAVAQDQTIDMVKVLNYTTFDIMAELTFGESLGLLDRFEYSPWVASIFNMIPLFPVVQFIKFYPWLERIINMIKPESVRKRERALLDQSIEAVNRRLERGSEKPDIWSLVSQGLSLDEMHSNAMFIMIAGSETTATLLSGLTYLLLRNPDKFDVLKKEIRSKFNTAENITFDQLGSLKYLGACTNEGLRLYPPVPIGLPRLTPPGGNVVMGRHIPGNMGVTVHQSATYLSPINFKNPTLFVPERWLGDPEYASDYGPALQPFILGPHNCLGQAMAHLEMRLIVAKLLFHFDLDLNKESYNWMDQKTYTIWHKKPLLCQVRLAT